MKKIVLTINNLNQLHSLWKNFLSNPPKDFEYYTLNGKLLNENEKGTSKSFTAPSGKTSYGQSLKEKLLRLALKNSITNQTAKFYKTRAVSKKISSLNPDIVYGINGQLLKTNTPWVVDAENVGVFTVVYNYNAILKQHYRNFIEKILASESCKAILPYSDTSKYSILATLNCDKFIHKIQTAHNIVKYRDEVNKIPHENFTILFTGSHQNEDEFWNRGGREVLLSFFKLFKTNPKIKLVLRCKIPELYRKKVISNKNIEHHEKPLPVDEFESLFLKSDIYVFPAYTGYGITILDAMNYGLPVITTDFLENGEKIENYSNGFKIPIGKNLPRFYLPYIPIHFTASRRPPVDKHFINSMCEKIQYLIDNDSELVKMGKNSRKKLKEEFSLEAKNKMLERIYQKI